jgi:LytS/YehU family sensor histidine kinase
MIFHQYLLLLFGVDFKDALADNIIFNVILIVDCYLVSNMLQYYKPNKDKFFHILFVSLFLSAFWVLFCKWAILHFVNVNQVYVDFLSKTMSLRFINGALLMSVVGFASQLCYRFEDQNQQLKLTADAEKLTRDAELFKLRQQLQPHFLFNSLNSISSLIGSKPEEARKMIHQLSDFLRGTLKREDVPFVTLAEELEYLTLYLDIEKVRFGHRLETEILVDESILNCNIPPMLLQPIVENAIKFGLYDTIDDVKITISGIMKDKILHIEVKNPFDAITSTPRKGTGFGLSAIDRRLFLLFFRNDLLKTNHANNIFTTTVLIPQKND